MADLPAPTFLDDPSQYQAYLDAQRKQQMVQMLMGSLQQANTTPADWNSMKVVPKRGMLQNLSVLADALMTKKAMDSSNQANSQYLQGLYGGAQQPNTNASPAAVADANIGAPGIARDMQATPNTQPASNPNIPPGMNIQQARALLRADPKGYWELIGKQYEPTDLQKLLRLNNIQPGSPEYQSAMTQALAKANYLAPNEEREGSVMRDALTHQVIGQNPKTPMGGINFYDAQGNLTGQGMTPGAVKAIADSEGAATAGKVLNTPAVVPNAGGGSTYGFPSDILGKTAPVLRDQSQAQPAANPSIQAPKVGQQNIQQNTVAKSGDPWSTMPKLQVSNSLGAPNAFVEGTLKASGEKHAALSTKYGEESDLADQKLAYNAEALKALPNAEVGPMSEWLTHNRARLTEMGVPDKLIPGDGSVTPTLELNKYLKNAALQGAKATFGSRMTQNEVMLQHEELSPSTSMTRDAISSLMAQDNVKQQYAKQRATDYGNYVQKGGDPLRFEAWYSRNFPLTQFAKQQTQAVPVENAQPTKPSPSDIEAELRRRGLIK